MIRMAWPDDLVPRSRMGFRRHGHGASSPANPCFFVIGHHAPCLNRGSRPDDVVPHRSRALVSSSSSTTPDGRIGARGRTAWCLTARKPLFLRRRAPRRMGESEHGEGRRGASPPANPCFFVTGHHVGWVNRSTGTDGVVPHRPQTLIPSSSSTTPDGRIRARGRTAWCLTARKPLSLRRRAPRPLPESGFGTG